MKSRRIYTVEELDTLAFQRRSVVGWRHDPLGEHPKPAAWVICMQARVLNERLKAGVFLYEPYESGMGKRMRRERGAK